jgi:hypothetical protein
MFQNILFGTGMLQLFQCFLEFPQNSVGLRIWEGVPGHLLGYFGSAVTCIRKKKTIKFLRILKAIQDSVNISAVALNRFTN